MRMRKITEAAERPTLATAAKDFIAIKQAQMLSDETLRFGSFFMPKNRF